MVFKIQVLKESDNSSLGSSVVLIGTADFEDFKRISLLRISPGSVNVGEEIFSSKSEAAKAPHHTKTLGKLSFGTEQTPYKRN